MGIIKVNNTVFSEIDIPFFISGFIKKSKDLGCSVKRSELLLSYLDTTVFFEFLRFGIPKEIVILLGSGKESCAVIHTVKFGAENPESIIVDLALSV